MALPKPKFHHHDNNDDNNNNDTAPTTNNREEETRQLMHIERLVPPKDKPGKKFWPFGGSNSKREDKASVRKDDISGPIDFVHEVHVGFDPKTGEFSGLPPQWSALLQISGISKNEIARNPQAMVDVLGFYTEDIGGGQEPKGQLKYMTVDGSQKKSAKQTVQINRKDSATPGRDSPSSSGTAAQAPPVVARPEFTKSEKTK
ncbi:uncharacterized protein MONBRDRAFT_6420, partial [Monosiga brevicollis MX1]